MGDNGSPAKERLYEQLGGWGGLAVIAELWCDRVLADARLAEYFAADEGAAVKKEITEFLVYVTGGPMRAPAQPLPALFAKIPTTEQNSERLLGHLVAALVWSSVATPLIGEMLDVVSAMSPKTWLSGDHGPAS